MTNTGSITARQGIADESANLRVYRFDPDSVFEGALVGAIERLSLGRDTKPLDGLFVRHDPARGGLAAVDLASGSAGGTFASMLDFRLDPGRREAITRRTLAEHRGGVPRSLIEAVAAPLEPGAAILAVLHTGGAPIALDDAVARCHGRLIANTPVAAQALADAGPQLLAAVTSPAARNSAR